MRNIHIRRISAAFLVAGTMILTPLQASASVLQIGSRGTQVQNVQTALKHLGFFQYHTATGYYGTITQAAVKDFQKSQGMAATGVADQKTVAAIQNQSKEVKTITAKDPGKRGALDWFKVVQYAFPRDANAVVIDVDTGKSFTLKRTYGTNHADVEPLTQKDAQIIKEIWGGWSWERRAVVVQIGDYAIAGSMTAFPHAGLDSQPANIIVNNRSGGYGRGVNLDAVKGNGVDGHMDIHFLNSRTHGTNVVQKVHQDMVQKAAKYISEKGL